MGRTVPSYRIALESEIDRWKPFAKALSIREKAAFEELTDCARNHAMAGGAACNPVLFEPMVMSILLERQNRLLELEEKLNILIAKSVGLKVVERP